MGIKKGTKLTAVPKDRTIKFRLDAETESELNFLSESTGRTKAKIIRDGIHIQYKEEKDK